MRPIARLRAILRPCSLVVVAQGSVSACRPAEHAWGEPRRLPHGTDQMCSRCKAWKLSDDDGWDLILPREAVANALEILRTEAEILGDQCICRTREIGCPCPQHGYSDEGLRR